MCCANWGQSLCRFRRSQTSGYPENIDGLYLGGGYPELYEKRLSENEIMRNSIQKAIQNGLPTVAECGGFLYLMQSLDGAEMAGCAADFGAHDAQAAAVRLCHAHGKQ